MPIACHAAPLGSFCVVLAAICLKHFIADFLLQTNWIARGKERAVGWLAPLTIHLLCHALLSLLIVVLIAPHLWWLAAVEFVVHGTIDRVKTIVARLGALNPAQPGFWWLLGFDQFLHQATNIALAAALFTL